jgi:hypothetical protein
MATTKKYIVTTSNHNRGTQYSTDALTLPELVEYFKYTLDVGASYAWEKGNKKINKNPTTIKSLVSNLAKAKDNAAMNGYSGYSYDFTVV